MEVHVVLFRHASHDRHDVTEVYREEADAVRRLAELARQNTEDSAVAGAFARGDYDTCLRLFVEECDAGADHQIALVPAELS